MGKFSYGYETSLVVYKTAINIFTEYYCGLGHSICYVFEFLPHLHKIQPALDLEKAKNI